MTSRERFNERRDAALETMGERRDAALETMGERRDAALEAMGERRDAAIERVADARDAATERMAGAREAAADRVADARAAAAEQFAKVKPRLRGVTHEYAFFVSLVLGAALIVLAKGFEARLAIAVYAVSLSALFGVSALYHRVDWQRPEVRRWMRRLDHTMIFLLIAVWAGAAAGAIVELIWIDAPKWISAVVYIAVGMIGAIGFPAIVAEAGIGAGVLIAGGGALYATGAIIYAAQRPNPSPTVFGYHEIFHVLVIAAAAAHFAAIALFALPA